MKILRFFFWALLVLICFNLNYFVKLISPNWLLYILYLRVPLVGGLLLLLFPVVAIKVKAISPLLRNLFVMRKWYQVSMGIFAATIAGRAIVVTTNAILENAPARLGVKQIFAIPFPWDYLAATILGLPIILGIILETRIERKWWSKIDIESKQKYDSEIVEDKHLCLGIASGVLLSIGLFMLEGSIFQVVNSISPILTEIVKLLFVETDGYIDDSTHLLNHHHLNSIVFSIICSSLYIIVGYWFRPILSKEQKERWKAPVLIYISSLFNSVVIGFGEITFFFDKFRLPVFLIFLLFSSASYWIWQVDHFFKLSREQNTNNSLQFNDFSAAIEKRLAYQGDRDRTLVVVTASGGGIHAAGWTTQVLTGLQKLLGEEFTKAIGLISSVSGGSVGTMYFLDLCENNGCPKPANLEKIVKNAVQDGLNSVGWGLVYRDFWRLVGFPWIVNKNEDRGTALEINWQNSMLYPHTKLSDWRSRIFDGEIPIPVFNTTLVEDGRRLLVSPMTFAQSDREQKIDSNTLYQKDGRRYDLNAVTAARLSATFPYVSPSVRNPDIGIKRNYHIMDGGYFDNSGVVTAIEWLDDNMDDFIDKLEVKRLVFIEIEAGEAQEIPPEVKGDSGWFMAIFGALQALLTVRDSSLLLRNQQEIDLFLKHYRSKLDNSEIDHEISNVQYLRIDFPRRSQFRFERKGIGKEYSQPLSWKLTASQKYVLEEAWQGITLSHPALGNLKQMWHGAWGFPAPHNNKK
jgi:hypothetical protein